MADDIREKLEQLAREGMGSMNKRPAKDYSHYTGYDTNRRNGSNKGNNYNNKRKVVNEFSNQTATAPYNFISLPSEAMHSALDKYITGLKDEKQKNIEQSYKNYIEEHETISGYIDLELETLTPVFIRNENGMPFKLGDTPVLPGSSLRGMFKHIFKIITMSTLRAGDDYIDRHVFFRRLIASKGKDFRWAHDLHELYSSRLKSDEGSKVRPGFLVKVKNGYFIVPVARDYRDAIKHFIPDIISQKNKYRKSDIIWSESRAYIWTGTLGIYELRVDKRTGEPKGYLFDTLEDYNKEKERCKNSNMKFDKGKQLIRFLDLKDADWNVRIPVNIDEYLMDNNRGGVNLVDKNYMKKVEALKANVQIPTDISAVSPCYYVPDENQIELFGHGQCFRIPYKHTIGDIIKKSLSEDVIDYTDAVFGRSPYFASRVFFEDAMPGKKVDLMSEFRAHPLLQPNPTSFQLYLKNEIGKQLANWDSSNAEIRGYKLYWHQGNGMGDYKADDMELKEDDKKEKNKKLCLPMRPISANTRFHSRIRFKNLLPEELGALVMTLDINGMSKNIAFKLGQGKSLGLGSIKLNKHELYVESKEAYTSFLSGNTMADSCEKAEASAYKKLFEQSIPGELQSDWTHIMKELSDMLDFDNTKLPGWTKETSAMKGRYERDKRGNIQFKIHKGFEDRRALPTVEKVIERSKNVGNRGEEF